MRQSLRRAFLVPAIALAAVTALLGGAPRPASAEDWPARPITLVIASTAGGMMELIARSLAQDMSASLGQPVVVEFRPGGGSVIGVQAVARAEPDGYTLLQTNIGPMVFRPLMDKAITYDANKDFTPISLVADTPNAVLVNPKVGVKSIKDLLAYAETKDHKLSIAHPGIGTMGHLCGVLLAKQTKIEGNYIAYRGGQQIILDLMGGQIDLGTPAYGPGMDQVIIAVAGDKRLEAQPNLPTLKESGIDVVCSTWTGIYGPPNMPPAIVAKLNAAIEASLRKPDVREKFQKIGLQVLGGPPGKMSERVAADRVQWTDIIKGLNIDFSK
jgi:tripartite-type tricarboxylate transporter receptor subunit TctC